MKNKEIVLFWSGGKDSALALYLLKQNPALKIKALITTFNKHTNTVPFHGVNETLIKEQSQMIGIPLHRVYLPERCPNIQYEQIIGKVIQLYHKQGIKYFAFGDRYQPEIKKYRENLLAKYNCQATFPLWDKTIDELKHIFINNGFRAVITAIHTSLLSNNFLGKELNSKLLEQLAKHIEPFGDGGAYHTLVTYAPFFKQRLATSMSTTILQPPYEISQLRLP